MAIAFSIVERKQIFLARARQEERAARAATCTEARLAHQGLAARLRSAVVSASAAATGTGTR